MTSSRLSVLRNYYDELSDRFTVVDRVGDYASLVVPSGNESRPVYRWFRYKEAFSHALLERLLKDVSWPGNRELSVCDPFVGSGTSLLSACHNPWSVPVHAVGVERNPFVAVLARAKVAAVTVGRELENPLEIERRKLLARYRDYMRGWRTLTTESVTLNNARFFPAAHTRSLLALGRAAAKVEDPDLRAVFQTCVASAIEPSGRLRRDGRALRYVPNRIIAHPLNAFERALRMVVADLPACEPPPERSVISVLEGDARAELSNNDLGHFEWSVFSPPYPNNIDYTEVYKLEGWVLGFFETTGDMREQRLSTLRSHPSVLFPDGKLSGREKVSLLELLTPVLDAVPRDRYTRGRIQVIQGYAEDMLGVFRGLQARIMRGGHVACVVGNSVHGTGGDAFVIASDLILAAVGELAGFEVKEIAVARTLRRRGDRGEYARESVINFSSP